MKGEFRVSNADMSQNMVLSPTKRPARVPKRPIQLSDVRTLLSPNHPTLRYRRLSLGASLPNFETMARKPQLCKQRRRLATEAQAKARILSL